MKVVDILAGVAAVAVSMALASVIMLGVMKFVAWVLPIVL